jgi:hypothetical protein
LRLVTDFGKRNQSDRDEESFHRDSSTAASDTMTTALLSADAEAL